VEDWAEIRRLRRAEGMPIARIARVLGISRNKVKAARGGGGPRYARAPTGSVADGFEPRIRELLAAFPSMPTTAIAERVAVFNPDVERPVKRVKTGESAGRGDQPAGSSTP